MAGGLCLRKIPLAAVRRLKGSKRDWHRWSRSLHSDDRLIISSGFWTCGMFLLQLWGWALLHPRFKSHRGNARGGWTLYFEPRVGLKGFTAHSGRRPRDDRTSRSSGKGATGQGPRLAWKQGSTLLTTPHPCPRLGQGLVQAVIFWVLKEGSGSSTGDVPGWMPSLDSGRSDAQSSCLWTAEQPQAWVACSRSDTRRDLHRSWVRSPQGQQVLFKRVWWLWEMSFYFFNFPGQRPSKTFPCGEEDSR